MPWEADLRSRSVVQRCASRLLPVARAFPCQPGLAGGYEDALPHLGIGSSSIMARHARCSSDTPLTFSPVTTNVREPGWCCTPFTTDARAPPRSRSGRGPPALSGQ